MLSHSAMSDSLRPCGLPPVRPLCPWGFSRQEYWSGLPLCPPGDLPNPGIKPRSPTLQSDSLLSKPPGKPKNTGVGSLSLFQGIFSTEESNQGLLHCRQILYQMSYQGSSLPHINLKMSPGYSLSNKKETSHCLRALSSRSSTQPYRIPCNYYPEL